MNALVTEKNISIYNEESLNTNKKTIPTTEEVPYL